MAATTSRPASLDGSIGLPDDDRSLGQIVGDLAGHSQQLLRGELAFAKREITENAKEVGGAAAIGAAAWPFALSGIVLLGAAAAFGLGEVMPTWAGFLIVAVLYLAIAAAFALTAKARLKKAQKAPTRSIDQAKEDLTWIKAHAG